MEYYSTSWVASVYRPSEWDLPEDWDRIKYKVFWRDSYKCQMCDRTSSLSVHHIMPRAEGGGNNIENLLTLCNDCHDTVELEQLRTAELIKNWYDEPIKDDRPVINDWHAWVYGGARRPAFVPKTKSA